MRARPAFSFFHRTQVLWLICTFGFLTSCQSWNKGEDLSELNLPVQRLQKLALRSLPVGKLKISRNQRIFYSQFFHRKGSKFNAAPKNSSKKQQLVIMIIGDRRPYRVNFQVKTWTRKGGEENLSLDLSLSRYFKTRFRQDLTKSREGTNVIDDFRPY